MTDQVIIKIDDVREIRNLSNNVDYFDKYAREVQYKYLQPLLGDELYAAMLDDLDVNGDPQTTRFIDLLDGQRYIFENRTRIFRGVKMYCSYLWLYMAPLDSEVNLTPIGAQIYRDQEAESAKGKQAYAQMRDECIKTASDMEEQIQDYLRTNQADFPEWKEGESVEVAERTNIVYRVHGTTFRSINQKNL